MPHAIVSFMQFVNSTASASGTFHTAAGNSTVDTEVVADAFGLATSNAPFTAEIFAGQASVTAQVWEGYEAGNATATADFPIEVTAPAAGVQSTDQDMWWGGDAENGWGISLIQHDHRMFVVVFAYDKTGAPTWFVVPDAKWEFGDGLVLHGTLYSPTGTAYSAFQPGSVVAGASVGTLDLIFTSATHAASTFTFTSDPSPGFVFVLHKSLTRMQYQPSPPQADHGVSDMWWGGSNQSGWGISVLEQAGAIFSVWYTYGADGKATWFVMPGGQWNGNEYDGNLYITANPTFHTQHYDPAQLTVQTAGTYHMHVLDPTRAILFEYSIGSHSDSLALLREPF
jgi:hypothetical protein